MTVGIDDAVGAAHPACIPRAGTGGNGYGLVMPVGERYPILPIPWVPEDAELIPAGVVTIGVGHRVLDEATAKAYLDDVGFVRADDQGAERTYTLDGDPMEWALERLRTRMPEVLAKVGAPDLAAQVDLAAIEAALPEVLDAIARAHALGAQLTA